jgi:NAD(P)-dependent dehydrogenase (short-subunit alcohol dehydrogenase family)
MTSLQKPINSGFTAASTSKEVIRGIDLSGKYAIVTGGYSGLGLETAKTLASAGAKVLVPARDVPRALANIGGTPGIEVEQMDLLDPASIAAFAARFLATGRPLHLLLNSAGIMASPLSRDARGYESQFATNHLGHFQLTRALWPALKRAQKSRVVSVSSWGHRYSPVVLEDVNFERRPYDRWLAYGQSKTANILFAVELAARGQADGISAFSLHPGGILSTGLGKHLDTAELTRMGVIDADGKFVHDPSRQLKTVEEGAATIVWCATSPQLEGLSGAYCENSDVAPLLEATEGIARTGVPARGGGVYSFAVDPLSARELWALSERLLG